ncbi:hypothetical protein IEQ34_012244 [Dendrobium chrysotoxum]|uniref:Uncharacterized protein n=1 Tax=Dendrobium chrysotoxum TaxID=161865 RepID=A0AAV7GTM1_DENCH|nr:hypothetical protein IEQ34_012244 [Dendrobium chrysotoxum]
MASDSLAFLLKNIAALMMSPQLIYQYIGRDKGKNVIRKVVHNVELLKLERERKKERAYGEEREEIEQEEEEKMKEEGEESEEGQRRSRSSREGGEEE